MTKDDQLSPLLGKLIDAAKAAAATGDEGVALLCENGSIYAASHLLNSGAHKCAAVIALADAKAVEAGDIVAAAVARKDTGLQTVVPCSDCYAALVSLDPGLPLVIKRVGRWILTSLSDVAVGPSH